MTFTTSLGTIPASSTTRNGRATALLTSATVTGTAVVTATTGAVTGTVRVDFVPGPLARVDVTPTGPRTVIGGSSIRFAAQGRDAFGNAIPGLAYNWSVVPGTGNGVVSQTGVFTGTAAGTATVRAISGGITGSSGQITVEHPPTAVTLASFNDVSGLGGWSAAAALSGLVAALAGIAVWRRRRGS